MVENLRPANTGAIQQPDANPAPLSQPPAEQTRTEIPQPSDDYAPVTSPAQPLQTPTTDPVTGARGPGAPVGPTGADVTPPLRPGPVAIRVDRAAYLAAHRDDPVAARGIVAEAEIWAPAAGQDWQALVRQVYGQQLPDDVTPASIELLAEAVGMINGRSTLEAPPAMVAVPQLEDLNRLLQGMRRDRAVRNEPIVRNAAKRFAGEHPKTTELPTSGRAYETRWNDTLRGIALHAYRDQLAGLEPEEADRRLACIMLSVAYVNGLNSTDVADAGVIWMPPPENIRGFLARISDPGRLHQMRRENPELWQSIRRTGVDAVRDLNYNRNRTIAPATATGDLAGTIDATDAAVRTARFIRVLSQPPEWNFWGMFSFPWLFELYTEEPPSEDELPIRRDGEDFAAYLDRVAPNMPPEEYRRVLENPGRFMMRAAGIINGNGDVDPARGERFTNAMQRLGLVNAEGRMIVTPETGETLADATKRVTFEAMRRANVAFTAEPADSLEQVVQSAQGSATPEQKQLLRQLVIWNQLVQLSAEAPATTTVATELVAGERQENGTGPGASSFEFNALMDELLAASSYGYPESYQGAALHDYPDYGDIYDNWDYIDIDPDYGTYYDDITEEDEAEDRVAAKAIEDNMTRRREAVRAGVSTEDDLARRSHAKSTQAVIEQHRAHAKEVVEKAVDHNVGVNQQEARGERVGGPGRHRRGS